MTHHFEWHKNSYFRYQLYSLLWYSTPGEYDG